MTENTVFCYPIISAHKIVRILEKTQRRTGMSEKKIKMCDNPGCSDSPVHAIILDENDSLACPIPIYCKDHAKEAIYEYSRTWASGERLNLLREAQMLPLPEKIPEAFEGATFLELVAEYEEHLRRQESTPRKIIIRFYHITVPGSAFLA